MQCIVTLNEHEEKIAKEWAAENGFPDADLLIDHIVACGLLDYESRRDAGREIETEFETKLREEA